MSRDRRTREWPPVSDIRWDDAHRLIPAAFASQQPPFVAALSDHPDDAGPLMELMAATNARLQAQDDALPGGIGRDELVFGVPQWPIINAAFCHPHPAGARFSSADRGAWYAARFVRTALREVAFHKTVELAETAWWDLAIDFQDVVADLHGTFHDLRTPRDARAKPCLSLTSYRSSQALAERLLAKGSLGIVYPSVRDEGRGAITCFRPATVANARLAGIYRMRWSDSRTASWRRVG